MPTIPHPRRLTRGVRCRAMHLIAAALALACAPGVLAQVVIDMPAPRKRAIPIELREPPRGASAQVMTSSGSVVVLPEPEPGELALARYARARTAPYDTYSAYPYHAGIRTYGYPVFWFPFFRVRHHHFGFPFFGFNFTSGFCF